MTAAAPASAAPAPAGPAPANPGLQNPLVPLNVPAEFAGMIATAVSDGAKDAVSFAREHNPRERWLVPGWALLKMGWPPKKEEERKELEYLHEVAKGRTTEQTVTARYYSDHGLTDAWEVFLAEYSRRVPPRQAKAAAKLLHDTLNMVNEITQTAKAAAGRQRPFTVDPNLPLAVDKPGNSPSYPSGHTSAAIAAALVLSHLMPERAKEFMDVAMQATWARVYAGVHFPSDVVAGATLASTVASYMVGTGDARAAAGAAQPARPGKRPKQAA